ncbi:hypothetical protein GGF32_004226 [Allomyces javanicus]|nr:hypothetical protein GGF32_004226 [Allomyces javanicus]
MSQYFEKMSRDFQQMKFEQDAHLIQRIESTVNHCQADQVVYDNLLGIERNLSDYQSNSLSAVHSIVRSEMDVIKHDTRNLTDIRLALSSIIEQMGTYKHLDEAKYKHLALQIGEIINSSPVFTSKIEYLEHNLKVAMGTLIPSLLRAEVSNVMNALGHISNRTASMNDVSKLLYSISEKLGVASTKGDVGENLTYDTLIRLFPSHTFNRIASSPQKGASDIVLEKDGFPKILVEVKMYKTTVNKNEPNFHVDIIQDRYIVMYLSNTQFDMEPIMSAVSTIYELDSILTNIL